MVGTRAAARLLISEEQRAEFEAIMSWTAHNNEDPKPFIWHAKAEDIIAKIRRGRATLSQVESKTQH